eukprot:3097225-Lingulodinium_polyedra.AAC.1
MGWWMARGSTSRNPLAHCTGTASGSVDLRGWFPSRQDHCACQVRVFEENNGPNVSSNMVLAAALGPSPFKVTDHRSIKDRRAGEETAYSGRACLASPWPGQALVLGMKWPSGKPSLPTDHPFQDPHWEQIHWEVYRAERSKESWS